MCTGNETYRELPNVAQGVRVQLCDVNPLQVTGQQSHALCGGQSGFSCMSLGAGTSIQQPSVPQGVPLVSCTWLGDEMRQARQRCRCVPKDTGTSVLVIGPVAGSRT